MKTLLYCLAGIALVFAIILGGAVYLFYHYGQDLPDHKQLASYEPSVMTRVHASDGGLLAEYAMEKRVFVPISAMPKPVIEAFLSAEDKNFYSHFGVDLISVVGAIIRNATNLGSEKRLVGASTITQQVAKNFLLSNDPSLERKFKEAILAIRIEDAFTKDRILELYLNEIYLGFRSFGVAAAALNYFNKSLDDLTLSEVAYLAALPKAPNNYHPVKMYESAIQRRNWVISQMLANNKINADQANFAKKSPIRLAKRYEEEFVEAPYFSEEVRRWLFRKFGETTLYGGGLTVRTTLNPVMQSYADKALRDGLLAYDERHGWRGSLANISSISTNFSKKFLSLKEKFDLPAWSIGVVKEINNKSVDVYLEDQSVARIAWPDLEWAVMRQNGRKSIHKKLDPSQIFRIGDVIYVELMRDSKSGKYRHILRQLPLVSGAIIVLNPHTGAVLAVSGGFDFKLSSFNRATQAYRQPGSAFKPFVYLAALDNGLTPASLILDAPYVIDQGKGLGKWKPENYSQKFYGPSTMRLGLEKSRNLMTVRIAQRLGMDKISKYAKVFNIDPELPLFPSMALGAGETTVLRLTAAYSMLVNGGHYIEPAFVERIQDRNGRTIYNRGNRQCSSCKNIQWAGQSPIVLEDYRTQIADPRSAYQVVSMLEGVVLRGTGKSVSQLGKPLAGKTGTTNQFRDAWFVGFSSDIAVGVYVGYDNPKSLGSKESGGKVAAPIFREFMRDALEDVPAVPFRVPTGIRFMSIDAKSGFLSKKEGDNMLIEAFQIGNEPSIAKSTRKNYGQKATGGGLDEGVGGLY